MPLRVGHRYHGIGNIAAAQPLYEQALEIRRSILGEEHPDFAQSLHNLALLHQGSGNSTEAEPLLRQALEVQRSHKGEDHADTLPMLQSLAMVHQLKGEFKQAETVLRRVVDQTTATSSDHHPGLVGPLTDLALYAAVGNEIAAEPLFRRVEEINRQTAAEDAMARVSDLQTLSHLARAMGEYERALPYAQQAVEVLRRTREQTIRTWPVLYRI